MTAMNLNARNYRDACRATVSIGAAVPGYGAASRRRQPCGCRRARHHRAAARRRLLARHRRSTEQAFRPLKRDGATARGYFTGDWAERVDGRVYFKDRLDFQVKVHGYRLELDESQPRSRIAARPAVCDRPWNDFGRGRDQQIDGKTFDEAALQAALALKISTHAIPTLMRVVPRIPRNDQRQARPQRSRRLAEGGRDIRRGARHKPRPSPMTGRQSLDPPEPDAAPHSDHPGRPARPKPAPSSITVLKRSRRAQRQRPFRRGRRANRQSGAGLSQRIGISRCTT